MTSSPQTHLFVDESRMQGKGRYIIAATIVEANRVVTVRKNLKQTLSKKRHQFHATNESDRDRRNFLAAAVDLKLRTALYTSDAKHEETARKEALTGLLDDTGLMATTRLIIESRNHRDIEDRRTISQTIATNRHFTFDHLKAIDEPLLWIPDLVAWRYGRKDQWRKRILDSGLIVKTSHKNAKPADRPYQKVNGSTSTSSCQQHYHYRPKPTKSKPNPKQYQQPNTPKPNPPTKQLNPTPTSQLGFESSLWQ